MSPGMKIVSLICVLGTVGALAGPAWAQNIRERARVQAQENPGVALHVTGPPGDYRPKKIAELVRKSDLVVQGRLTRINSYLGTSEDRILTDYRIDVEQVVAGSLPEATPGSPGFVPPLILTVFGGDLLLEGVLIRATDPDRHQIMEGRPYLLFLTRSRSGAPSHYEIHHGAIFEVGQAEVKPLLRQGETIFTDVADRSVDDVVRSIGLPGSDIP